MSGDAAAHERPMSALAIGQAVCEAFLATVVRDHVFGEAELSRGSGPLDETRRQQVNTGQRVDQRTPELVRLSGKGGWSQDPERRAAFAPFANVSLLDHLLSVVRGALVFAAVGRAAPPAGGPPGPPRQGKPPGRLP